MTKVKLSNNNLSNFIKIALSFCEDIFIYVDNTKYNAKSLFSVMKLLSDIEEEKEYDIAINTKDEYIINKFNTYIENFNKGEIK